MWHELECATSSVLLSTFGSNPLIGCFKSISVNMAEIMQPNLASKMILFVKPVWYSGHSQPNHLVAVFALSPWNITLSDLVTLSVATSLKWVMIINSIGHVQWNHIYLQICTLVSLVSYIWEHKQARCKSTRNHSTIKIIHLKPSLTVQHLAGTRYRHAIDT